MQKNANTGRLSGPKRPKGDDTELPSRAAEENVATLWPQAHAQIPPGLPKQAHSGCPPPTPGARMQTLPPHKEAPALPWLPAADLVLVSDATRNEQNTST